MKVAYVSQGIDVIENHVVSVETPLGTVVFSDMNDATIIAETEENRKLLSEKVVAFFENDGEGDPVANAQKFAI